jgi:cell division cycle 20, cofactor of APC complex
MDLDVCRFNLSKDTKENGGSTGKGDGYDEALRKSLFEGKEGSKVLALQSKAPAPPPGYTSSSLRVMYSQARQATVSKRSLRHIPQTPERILDAPNIVDDFYLNLVDWNSQNVLAVALGTAVYLWNAGTGDIEQLMETSSEGDYITSVSWVTDVC